MLNERRGPLKVNAASKSIKIHKEHAIAENLSRIRQYVFYMCALSAIVVPIVVVAGLYLMGVQQPMLNVIGAAVCVMGALFNLSAYWRLKNLKLACSVHIVIANLSYGVALLASGGASSNIVIFAPLIVVIAGLLSGTFAVVSTAAVLCLELLVVEIYQWYFGIPPPPPQSSWIHLFNITMCVATVGAIIWFYEYMRRTSESSLAAVNAALLNEKIQNDQIMNAIDASAIVATTDSRGKITRVNENFCRISGYSAEELLGQDHRIINSGQHSKEFFVDIWRTISSGSVWSGEIENRRKDGSTYIVQTVITPLTNQDGIIDRYLAVRFDVTKEREVAKQLSFAQRVAKIGSWTYNVQHGKILWSKQMFDLHDSNANQQPPEKSDVLNFLHPEDRKDWLERFSECIESGRSYRLRSRVLTKAKRLVWLETVAEAVLDGDGKVIKVSGTSQDVTEMVNAEEYIKREQVEIRSRQRFLDTVLANLPSMIVVKDYRNELRYSLLNKASERFLCVSSEVMLNKCDYDLFPKDKADAILKADMEVFEKREPKRISNESIDTPGGKMVVSTVKVPTFDEDGQPEFLIAISHDITDELRTKEQLETERAKVVQTSKLASLGEMSAGIAHEINNPLTIIAGGVRALGKFSDQPKEFGARVQTINKSIERIGKIVSGLRKFSRTAGATEMKLHSVNQIIEEALVLTAAKSSRHNVAVQFHAAPEQSILCDEIEIEQVLVNLINNGIDAVKDRDERWVRLNLFEDGSDVVLEVSDSGLGISDEYREKLFQPFFTTKPVGEGTGLGLAIVRGILDVHKATIEVRADAPNTCFVIRFRKVKEAPHAV